MNGVVYFSRQDQAASAPRTVLRLRDVDRNVLFLGLTSLLTDVSSEMLSAVVPMYMISSLGFSGLGFGIFDGLQQGVTALLRIASGVVADRGQRHKEVAGAGYALSAACKAGLFALGSAAAAVVACLLIDRVGKGIRTAPRDALISLSSPRATLGQSFGVHRALDTVGALLGPVLAFVLLSVLPGDFDAVFLSSLCAALLGLGVLVLFVENRRAPEARAPEAPRESAIAALGDPEYRKLFAVAVVLSLATISDAFVYLTLQRRSELEPRYFPLLFVGTAISYLLLAVPAGRLADQWGRLRVFAAGYVLLALAYGMLLLPSLGLPSIVACLVLHGAFYAATDGVLMALAASMLPAARRATGMAALTTGMVLARLVASIAFGAAWTALGPRTATAAFAVALLGAIVTSAFVLRPAKAALP